MFKFEVNFWDEYGQEPNFERGVVGENSFGAAAEQVANYYGQDNIISLTLEELDSIILEEDISKIFKS